jgi:hypothetical protein
MGNIKKTDWRDKCRTEITLTFLVDSLVPPKASELEAFRVAIGGEIIEKFYDHTNEVTYVHTEREEDIDEDTVYHPLKLKTRRVAKKGKAK